MCPAPLSTFLANWFRRWETGRLAGCRGIHRCGIKIGFFPGDRSAIATAHGFKRRSPNYMQIVGRGTDQSWRHLEDPKSQSFFSHEGQSRFPPADTVSFPQPVPIRFKMTRSPIVRTLALARSVWDVGSAPLIKLHKSYPFGFSQNPDRSFLVLLYNI